MKIAHEEDLPKQKNHTSGRNKLNNLCQKSIKCVVRQRSICLWKANANRIAAKTPAESWLILQNLDN